MSQTRWGWAKAGRIGAGWFVAGLLVAGAAGADQCYVMPLDLAQKALAWLKPGTEIVHYCEPCEEGEMRRERIETAEVHPWNKSKTEAETQVNGEGIDAAYVFVRQEGKEGWHNLAKLVGCPAEGVSAELPDSAVTPTTAEGHR